MGNNHSHYSEILNDMLLHFKNYFNKVELNVGLDIHTFCIIILLLEKLNNSGL